jgi:7,8-dihydropterin-6-yl-methyl-4-(beta-D-ribofuranosyl)aminobenzene 5'-phosphate synthase
MEYSITALCENTAGMDGFLGEWGLSFLIEDGTNTVMLDTGTSISAVHNADTLGIDLSKVDKIVLSHGHYDHTGGLREVLHRMHKEIEIVAHPDIWQEKYSRRTGKSDRYIGIPFQRAELESLGARFNLTDKPTRISENIITTGEVPMTTEYESVDSFLMLKDSSGYKHDPVMDDQAVILKSEQGLIIVLGCAHRGMINTIYHAQNLTGIDKIHAVIGGSHLIGASEEQLWQSIAALRELEVQKLGLCHCTDLPVISVLAQEFADSFMFIKAGSQIKLPQY